MEYAMKLDHLTKDFGSFKLDDVSFAIPGGTILGLIGENGPAAWSCWRGRALPGWAMSPTSVPFPTS